MTNEEKEWTVSSPPTHWMVKAGPIINQQNRDVYLTVVLGLGLTSLVSVVGIIILAFIGKEIPQALTAIGSVAVGALGGLLTHK